MKRRDSNMSVAASLLITSAVVLTPVVLAWVITVQNPDITLGGVDEVRVTLPNVTPDEFDVDIAPDLDDPIKAPFQEPLQRPVKLKIEVEEKEEIVCDPMQVIRDSFKPKKKRCRGTVGVPPPSV